MSFTIGKKKDELLNCLTLFLRLPNDVSDVCQNWHRSTLLGWSTFASGKWNAFKSNNLWQPFFYFPKLLWVYKSWYFTIPSSFWIPSCVKAKFIKLRIRLAKVVTMVQISDLFRPANAKTNQKTTRIILLRSNNEEFFFKLGSMFTLDNWDLLCWFNLQLYLLLLFFKENDYSIRHFLGIPMNSFAEYSSSLETRVFNF